MWQLFGSQQFKNKPNCRNVGDDKIRRSFPSKEFVREGQSLIIVTIWIQTSCSYLLRWLPPLCLTPGLFAPHSATHRFLSLTLLMSGSLPSFSSSRVIICSREALENHCSYHCSRGTSLGGNALEDSTACGNESACLSGDPKGLCESDELAEGLI